MSKQSGSNSGISIGSASIVMIFAVLCLTIFAVLSFLTAHHERTLAEKSAQAVTEYYAADCQAVHLCNEFAQSALVYGPQAAAEALNITFENNSGSFSCPVNDGSALNVAFLWDGQSLDITRWQVVTTAAYHIDSSINVWPGN